MTYDLAENSKNIERYLLSGFMLNSFSSRDSPNLLKLQRKACQELKRHLKDRFSKSSIEDIVVANGESSPKIVDSSCSSNESGQEKMIDRLAQLLLLLPGLRSFNKQLLVELFFSGLIGNVQVENVIPFILKMDVLQIFGKAESSLKSFEPVD
uniref:NR LBD domain-containing protein n=1 Tax=Romanomermis culicivorax TaxID=13658 RepID=A0A915JCP1_ROMCU